MPQRRRPKTGKYTRYHIPLTAAEIKQLKKAARLAEMSARSFAAEAVIARL